ncbi:MAG: DUF2271 domain-containing protein [Sandaracinaceae bacterium]
MRWWTAIAALVLVLLASREIAHAQLDVTFATTRTGGRYYPAHVMAVWVTSPDGAFERTLYVWGGRRRRHLAEWLSSHPSSEALDGITSATLRTDAPQHVTWNMRDTTGAVVPDGAYLLHFELADTNSASANYREQFMFVTSPDGFDETLAMTPFVDVHIVYTPFIGGPDAGVAGSDAGPIGVDGGAGTSDGGASGGGPVIPIGRGYGSRGCAAATPSGRPWWVAALVGLGVLARRRRRRGVATDRLCGMPPGPWPSDSRP